MSFHHDPAVLFWLEEAGADWNESLREALAADPGGRLLRGVCSRRLNTSQLRTVKAAIAAAVAQGTTFDALRRLRIGLIGAGTLDFLADSLPGTAPRFGLRIEVAPVHFNAIATAAFIDSGFDGDVDVVVVMPDATTLRAPADLLDTAGHSAAVEAALGEVERLVEALRERHGCAVVVATIPPNPDVIANTGERAIPGSYARFVADLNAGIADRARDQRFILWDLDHIAATVGYRAWRDPIAMHVAKSPFSIGLAPLVADRLCAVLAAIAGKSRRALVLDLDNTLWSGVIGDDGVDGIVIGQGDAVGEAHLALHRFALELRRRGIVLAVCSKNEDATARLPFREHPDMLLREEHFAVFQANWSDKATNIRTIADELALNPDALVFVDDNPAERARVRQEFPEVAVPELPDDPAFYVSYLVAGGYFETATLGADDLVRAAAYQGNAKRADVRRAVGNYEEYLASLAMVLSVRRFDKVGRARIAQLTNKSNQFNLTTRRRQEPEIEAIELSPDHVGLQFRLIDSFGDNGMICVVVLHCVADEVEIDTWLMSCRVLERGVEQAVLNEIVAVATTLGAKKLIGEYIATPRNEMVRHHYQRLGFAPVTDRHDAAARDLWELSIPSYSATKVQMTIDRG